MPPDKRIFAIPLASIPSSGTVAVIFVEELIVKEELRASPLGILKNTPVTKSKPSPVNSTFDPVTPRNGP